MSNSNNETFLIIDQSLSGHQGHHYNYSFTVYNELLKRNKSAYIICNRSFRYGEENDKIIPAFSNSWQQSATAKADPLRKLVESINEKLPASIRRPWLRFIWKTKDIVYYFLKDPNHSKFLQELNQAENMLPPGQRNVYFFHSIHPDSLPAILNAKFDEIENGQTRLCIVLRAEPPTETSRKNLIDCFRRISENVVIRKHVRLFSDTSRLCSLYNKLSPIQFQCLPIPLYLPAIENTHKVEDLSVEKRCLTLGYLGDARLEKGYDLLPQMVNELADPIVAGKIKLVHQHSLSVEEPKIAEAMDALSSWPTSMIEPISAPLSADEYFDFVRSVDIVLLPYNANLYKARSSGILSEALAFGIPLVVPADTWMSDQIERGYGEVFTDRKNFVDAVRRAIENWPKLRANCMANRGEWRKVHSPKNLVEMLV